MPRERPGGGSIYKVKGVPNALRRIRRFRRRNGRESAMEIVTSIAIPKGVRNPDGHEVTSTGFRQLERKGDWGSPGVD